MKLKALLLAALFMVAAAGFITTDAKADGIVPTLMTTFGYSVTQKDKPKGSDVYPDWTGSWNWMPILGISATKGSASAEASIYLTSPDPASTTTNGVSVTSASVLGFSGSMTYNFANGLGLWAGKSGTPAGGMYAWENGSGDVWFMFSIPNPAQTLGVKFMYKGAYLGVLKASAASYANSPFGTPAAPATLTDSNGDTVTLPGNFYSATDAKKDTRLPALALGYSKFGSMSYAVNAVFQTFTIALTPTKDLRMTSYGANASFGTTVANVKFDLGGWYWVNPGDMNCLSLNFYIASSATFDTTDGLLKAKVENTSNYGAFLTLAYSIMPDLRASTGMVYSTGSNTNWKYTPYELNFYVSAKYNINPQVSITPAFDVQTGKNGGAFWGCGTIESDRQMQYRLSIGFGIST